MIRTAIIALAMIVVIGVGVVAGMIALSSPPETPAARSAAGLDFSGAMAEDLSGLPAPATFAARDGARLAYRLYGGNGAGPIVVLVHGSGWHGMQFHAMASRLAAETQAKVVVPDLRGHGLQPERRGDVDHIGQLEEDLADLIGHVRSRSPSDAPVILGGHSSGGGLVIRFAGGRHGGLADAFILMAPFLRHDAPTTRPNSGGWAHPAIARIIGLSILDRLGITAFHHLPVISFAMPRAVLDGPFGDTATTRYSYRMNVSFAPRPDYGADLAAIRDRPFLLLAGAEDEAFVAEAYRPTIEPHVSGGAYRILPGIGHLDIVTENAATDAIVDWMSQAGFLD